MSATPQPIQSKAKECRRGRPSLAKFAADNRGRELEATYSVAEVAEHFGVHVNEVYRLILLGRKHGAALDPVRGGLWPTFKISHKNRRIPLSAIERHKRHMARLEGMTLPAA